MYIYICYNKEHAKNQNDLGSLWMAKTQRKDRINIANL